MSYAIIRNIKYTRSNIMGIYRHNERINRSYSNKNINHKKTKYNYAIKSCPTTYVNQFDKLQKENNLKGWLKTNSNIACEYIITSDDNFFKNIGPEETKRFFLAAYEFVKSYKNLGDKYILSANVHMDESTPHMHLVFIPVIHKLDKQSGKQIEKISCSEFWKGKNSYRQLQDSFYEYITKAGFILERGDNKDNSHINIDKLKQITNYEIQQFEKQSLDTEQEIDTKDISVLKNDYKRVIKKFNTLANQYLKIKTINDNSNYKLLCSEQKNKTLKEENLSLKNEVNNLNHYINKTFECISLVFDWPIERLKMIINDFIKESDKNDTKQF